MLELYLHEVMAITDVFLFALGGNLFFTFLLLVGIDVEQRRT